MNTEIKLFVCGIPGTGKTTFGNYLEKNHNFHHLDLENPEIFEAFRISPLENFKLFNSKTGNKIISWGFKPTPTEFSLIKIFNSCGFKTIWFDGNRSAALKEYLKRNTAPEELFHIQVSAIDSANTIYNLSPIVYNTFEVSGQFKSLSNILREISSLM